tara:strand:- start:4153 stop:4641 length:489 start_codon:yes stop_codon:yes gene_type:complete
MFALISVNVYPQQAKDSTSINASEVERIVDKYTGKAVEGFNSVVDKITPSAEKGFEVAVKLQIAKGVTNLLPLFAFLFFLLLFNLEHKDISDILDKGKENGPSRYNYNGGPFYRENASVKLIIYLTFTVILFIVTLFSIADGILHLMAPEWYAIESIIQLFK